MIDIDKIDDGLPISVIVPTLTKRKEFFEAHVLPMVEVNEPAEIIIVSNEGSAPHQRNLGAEKATQEFIIFWDDDCIMPANFLNTLFKTLKNSNASYAYTGYIGIAMNPNVEPNQNFILQSMSFNANILKQYNYISTMTLIKREAFVGFDETLKRFQDWSLWLTLLEKGQIGVFIPNIKFIAFFNDDGQTSKNNSQVDAYSIIKKKHNL